MKTLPRWILFALPTVLVLVMLAGLVVWAFSGRVEVSALGSHSPLVEDLLMTIRERSIERSIEGNRLRQTLWPKGDEIETWKAGTTPLSVMKLYVQHCQMCHGGPGVGPDAVGLGLNPVPPALDGTNRMRRMERDAWIIANGLRMTGMPAYEITLTDREIWFLANWTSNVLPRMTPEEYARYSAPEGEVRTPATRSPEPPPAAGGDR